MNPLEPERIMDIVAGYFGVDVRSMRVPRGDGVVRGVVAELMYRYCDVTQAEIGAILGGLIMVRCICCGGGCGSGWRVMLNCVSSMMR
ncbi:MAG: hypothetical protein N3A65_09755 [candidate division WOR-3 bacterium]|nr:hypothetical protein [candidate division WOR-3 bacterium]